MVFRVGPTPTQFPTNILPTPAHTLEFYTKCVMPEGRTEVSKCMLMRSYK